MRWKGIAQPFFEQLAQCSSGRYRLFVTGAHNQWYIGVSVRF
jgi:hypothetical protein